MKLQFKFERVYGKLYFYPENDMAKSICEVAGRKVLKEKEVMILKKLGRFEVEAFSLYEFKDLDETTKDNK